MQVLCQGYYSFNDFSSAVRIVDVDDEARDVVLTIHWRSGQHSQSQVRKPRTGEHGCATSEDAQAVMRSMAGALV
jgi:hypothetical protein